MHHNWHYAGGVYDPKEEGILFTFRCINCGETVECAGVEKPPQDGCTGPQAKPPPKYQLPKLKRVDRPPSRLTEAKKYGPQCPACGALTILSVVPCPDGPKEEAPGVFRVCAAIHIGWRCESCGACYVEEG